MPRIVLPAEPLIDGPTLLRPWREADADAIVAAVQDPEIIRWTSVPTPYSDTDARLYLLQRHDGVLTGTHAPFAIVDADDDSHLLGSISLMRFAWEDLRAEVGYWLAPAGRGGGHATRAVRLICAWGFELLALDRIDLLAATGNTASQRIAERAGFTRELTLRSFAVGKQGRLDMVMFRLLAGELPPG
jgi:RimJ/RimL family protein N-acetyltransferase